MYFKGMWEKYLFILTGLKRRYHSDQLEHVKRAKAVSNETQNLKSEVAECQNVTQSGTKVVIHNAQESGQEAKHEKKLSVVGIKGHTAKIKERFSLICHSNLNE